MTRHFCTLNDLSKEELIALIDRAIELKALRGTEAHPKPLLGRSVAVLLEKASTRTRISFEVGIHELGALPVTLISKDTQLGRGEPLEDTAQMLSRYVHAVVYRTFGHDRITTLAAHATIPVINGLSEDYHPCQLLADLTTAVEASRSHNHNHGHAHNTAQALQNLDATWVGDGNNMAHSWIVAASMLGFRLRLACPVGYMPKASIVAQARALGGNVEVTADVHAAVKDANLVTTDVWASMGQEDEARARQQAFKGYCVDTALMATAAKDAIFLHCLPAHRGEEVSAAVIDGPQSRVWDEAENRLHTQKALLEWLVQA